MSTVIPVSPDPSPTNVVAVTVPVTFNESLSLTSVESSDFITVTTRSPSITMSPVPFGDNVMSVSSKFDVIVLPLISIPLPLESLPVKSYNSSKLLLIFSIAALKVSPDPELIAPI